LLSSPLFKSLIELLSMKQAEQKVRIEDQKVIAERINGWAAMMGFVAAVGAYLTTGQLIPGIV